MMGLNEFRDEAGEERGLAIYDLRLTIERQTARRA